MQKYMLLLVATLFLVLTACSSAPAPGSETDAPTPTNPSNPDDPTNPTEPTPGTPPSQRNYNKLGFVTIIDDRSEDNVSVLGGFYSYDKPFPDAFADNPFSLPNDASDDCTVTRISGLEPAPPVSPGEDYVPTSISAGAELSIDTGSSNYVRLPKQTLGDYIFYTAERDGMLPGGLNVTIPGDVFPAFAAVNFSVTPSFNLTKPATPIAAPITADSEFEWDAATGSGFITLSASTFDPVTGETVAVSCVLSDDGAFTFPATTKVDLGTDFESQFFSIGRTGFTTGKKDDAVLVLAISSSVSHSEAVTITP